MSPLDIVFTVLIVGAIIGAIWETIDSNKAPGKPTGGNYPPRPVDDEEGGSPGSVRGDDQTDPK